MDHLFRTKPSFLQVTEKQLLAARRIAANQASSHELAHCQRMLDPVPVMDVELPRVPLVRPKGGGLHYYVLGEAAQVPGKLLLVDAMTGAINIEFTAEQMELVPPTP
jgi:hypothetical protein